MNEQAQKITNKIKESNLSATFGIILILVILLFAGWHVYTKSRAEGIIKPLFGEEEFQPVEEVLFEDATLGEE